MRTGFNLLLWTTHVTAEHFPIFDDLKSVGYDGVEIPLFEGDPAHFSAVGQAVRDAGLACTAVTVLPDEERSAVSPNPTHREGAVKHLDWAISCAEALDANLLCGPYYQPLGAFTGDGPTDEELGWVAEVHQKAADRAAQSGLTLAVEPLNRFECYVLNTMEAGAAHAKRVGRPNLGILYDTFHANIEEKDPIGVIDRYAEVIKHVHISENDRGTPGSGHVDFTTTIKTIKATGYDDWLVIEAFGRALPALAAATRVWRDFFASKEEVYTVGLKTMKEAWAAA